MAEQQFQIGVKGLIRNSSAEILMVQIPAWGGNPGHWDFPGGRMEPGETFLEALARELQEEIGSSYSGSPKQIATVLTNITIPVGETKVPLVLIVYETALPEGAVITLDPASAEKAFDWFTPAEAADKLRTKFPADFCDRIATL